MCHVHAFPSRSIVVFKNLHQGAALIYIYKVGASWFFLPVLIVFLKHNKKNIDVACH